MFNKALFKLEWKSNYKILVIFCLILTMYTTIMLAMYDPKLGTALETFAKSMPEIMAMVGMSGTPTTLISLYLFIWFNHDCFSFDFWNFTSITFSCSKS